MPQRTTSHYVRSLLVGWSAIALLGVAVAVGGEVEPSAVGRVVDVGGEALTESTRSKERDQAMTAWMRPSRSRLRAAMRSLSQALALITPRHGSLVVRDLSCAFLRST
jgi:hypothetical protein